MGGRKQGPIKALVPSRTAEECHVALNRPDTVMMTGAGYKDQTRCPQLPCTVCIHIHLHVHIFIRSIFDVFCVYKQIILILIVIIIIIININININIL